MYGLHPQEFPGFTELQGMGIRLKSILLLLRVQTRVELSVSDRRGFLEIVIREQKFL